MSMWAQTSALQTFTPQSVVYASQKDIYPPSQTYTIPDIQYMAKITIILEQKNPTITFFFNRKQYF